MKSLRTVVSMFVLLFIASCTSFAAGSNKIVHTNELFEICSFFAEKDQITDLKLPEDNIYNRLSNFEDKTYSFQERFKKKHKTKFLIQHLNFSHYIKKPDRQFLLNDVNQDSHLQVPCPENNWLVRPAYYTFLFRLCPF